ncbi:Hypothetical predicted protein [Mytilus galloprovincialis]|uniref:AB hydrolase-1 domain-containing protein n=1 Tax=Mytilus galloprovincialis TaxID=29158 RepID=A0A8B6HJC0_MYTGA|nr:Hypothetical predicted protein [Mytilus galloprovincialis]
MGWVTHKIQYCVALSFGIFFAAMSVMGLIWRFIRHPIKSFTTAWPKTRDVMPACLNDPTLGSHGFIHLEEVRLHYVACGDESKPLMLFLHGFPEFWYSWRHQIREFKKDYRCLAIDLRGYADSDKPSGVAAYKTEKMIADIKQLIPAMGYSTCVLVSHDWGGVLAYQFAAKHQDMINKLIVMSAPHLGSFQEYLRKNKSQAKKSWYIMFFQTPWIPEIIFWLFDYETVKQVFTGKRSGLAVAKMSEEDVEAYKYALSRPGGLTAAINYYRAALRYPVGKFVNNIIETPTLVIWGCKDTALNKDLAALPAKFVPTLTVKYVEDASHWVQTDSPEEVNKLMREWLKA